MWYDVAIASSATTSLLQCLKALPAGRPTGGPRPCPGLRAHLVALRADASAAAACPIAGAVPNP